MGNSAEKFDVGEEIQKIDLGNQIQNIGQNLFPREDQSPVIAAAVENVAESLCHTSFNGDMVTIRYQLTRKFDPKEMDQDGNTPVHWACLKSHSDILKALLENGFQFDHQNKLGDTPLHFACASGFADGVKQLIAKGAKIWVRNKTRATPLHFTVASDRSDILGQLRRAGPEQFTAHVNDQNNKGDTALHWAAAQVRPHKK
jgi:ankyrin repeat protein